jgi:hypothetical protein
VGASGIQLEVIFSNALQLVSKESVRAIESQRERIRNLKNGMEGGMSLGAKEIRKQVFRKNFTSLTRSIVLFAGGLDFAKQPAEMDERIGDLLAWDRAVHGEQPPQKNLGAGVVRNK